MPHNSAGEGPSALGKRWIVSAVVVQDSRVWWGPGQSSGPVEIANLHQSCTGNLEIYCVSDLLGHLHL